MDDLDERTQDTRARRPLLVANLFCVDGLWLLTKVLVRFHSCQPSDLPPALGLVAFDHSAQRSVPAHRLRISSVLECATTPRYET
jgi:hypothetical protein